MNVARATLLVAVLAFATTAHAATISGITLTDLGHSVAPNAINNVGQVVGQTLPARRSSGNRAPSSPWGIWVGTSSEANDINDNGVAVGWAYRTDGKRLAAVVQVGSSEWNGEP